jgi:inorganic pyrophosphatase
MRTVDEDIKDDKIFRVAKNDIALNYINDLSEIPLHKIVELQRSFENYKKLENKHVAGKKFLRKKEGSEIINESLGLYIKQSNRLIFE